MHIAFTDMHLMKKEFLYLKKNHLRLLQNHAACFMKNTKTRFLIPKSIPCFNF